MPAFREIAALTLIGVAMIGIALGKLPFLRMNRAAIAAVAASALVAIGFLSPEEALGAIDLPTIVLLFAMMVVVGLLKLSGFFALVAAKLSRLSHRPSLFLAAVVLVAGLMSALFLNDTMCLVLTPIVCAACLRAGLDPLPYLVAVATAANVGSAATIIGNPQNMLIGSQSGISFSAFSLRMAPVALVGLFACWAVIRLVFSRRLTSARGPGPDASIAESGLSIREADNRAKRAIIYKGLFCLGLMLILFLAGVPSVLAAMVGASLALFTRRVRSDKILAQVDYQLLAFFAGLFVITHALARTGLWASAQSGALEAAARSPWLFGGVTTAVSNLISNVPAVMVLGPVAAGLPDPESGWLLLAMTSTFAGNLTLVGSVANLIVAEGAAAQGARLSFGDYLKAGVPITMLTLVLGIAMLGILPVA